MFTQVLGRGKIVLVLRLMAISFLMAVFMSSQATGAPVYTASYYTYASCIREGTSGIMANGRRLQDEGVCTAAMWKVPFGTKVKVKNVTKGHKGYGKEVIVTITDRGPAKRLVRQGRIIDLNYEAMHRLDGIKRGLIQVEITILD